jgi:proteasome accessory factor PafA2
VNRLAGIETEYGLYVESKGVADQVLEATALIRSCPLPAIASWDYRLEDPRRDMRGFHVSHLQVDPQDAQIERAHPVNLPERELKSDRVQANGARLYNDHAHPEYATPECHRLMDLIAHDKAGERILLQCAQAYRAKTGLQATLYKNNTDHHGSSYGCHESYLLARHVPFESLHQALIPFLVTRILYAGAGKVGVENDPAASVPYQLSQRADFFMEEINVETLYRRPIFNTRDEPHALDRDYRRVHVIAGDANLSEYALALKAGTTALVLDLLEENWTINLQIREPVRTIKQLSRDGQWKWIVELTDGKTIRAIDLQRLYLQAALERFKGRDAETDWLLCEWEATLNDLETDPNRLSDRLDWVAKQHLLEMFMGSEGLSWNDPALFSLDLEYHNIDPQEGLYYALMHEGHIRCLVSDEHIERAIHHAPGDTRAFIRGLCVKRFADQVETLNWEQITLRDDNQSVRVDLGRLVDGNVEALNRRLAAVEDITTFVSLLKEVTSNDLC